MGIAKAAADHLIERNSDRHREVAIIAADEAERVLPLFQRHRPADRRPAFAIDAIREWAIGARTLGMAEVRKLSLGAHAAARDCTDEAARHAARAAGQAVATWHVPAHWTGGRLYADKARAAAGSATP